MLAKLDDRATLLLDGRDAKNSCRDESTCDVDALGPEQALAGAHCTPQGRMVCDFRLLQRNEEQLLMFLPADAAGAALASLGKYIVFSKASLTDDSDNWTQFALWGEGLLPRLGRGEYEPGASWQRDGALFTVADAPDTVEVCVPAPNASAWPQTLGMEVEAVTASAYRIREIDHGIGHVRGATTEMFLPQMLNMEHTGRISFTKGCYTGQEVIARLHYRGKGKRSMQIAAVTGVDGLSPAAPGDALFKAGKQQSIGNVVSAEPYEDGFLLLAVVATEAMDAPVLLGESGPELRFQPLPYSVTA